MRPTARSYTETTRGSLEGPVSTRRHLHVHHALLSSSLGRESNLATLGRRLRRLYTLPRPGFPVAWLVRGVRYGLPEHAQVPPRAQGLRGVSRALKAARPGLRAARASAARVAKFFPRTPNGLPGCRSAPGGACAGSAPPARRPEAGRAVGSGYPRSGAARFPPAPFVRA